MQNINWIKLFVIGLFAYTLLALYLGVSDLKNSISYLPHSFWLFSLISPLSVHLILSLRWHFFLRYLQCNINYFESFSIYLPGLSLIAAPARSGEAIRGLWLKSRFNLPVSLGISCTFVERIGELISALIIIIWSLYFTNFFSIPILLFFTITCSYFFHHFKIIKKLTIFSKNLHFYNSKFLQRKIFKNASLLVDKVNTLCLPYPLALSVLLSLVAWLIEAYLLYRVFSFLNVEIAFKHSALIRTVMGMGGVISFLPAGLITAESTGIAMALAYGSGRVEAVAATIFIRIYTLFIPFILGLFSYSFQKDIRFSK
ncbi:MULTISPECIES: lysylphosphatidylglycerol synthase transmembrane domain-containing protein [Prochlorococcus]|uniref:Uncharacterized conserved membrane protein n=1 Tax=Prochlorococcus marinus (strain SARG / CCMP1375 / SS120) TaxID=167539 RepID=Q7VEF2_PROMA|nr:MULTISPECIES: lysylphosphatidylglycerol synthase transmembrane domain-containing protein [Prochlorococcus]AAP99107.1 Uncharacterized conserved membrane protein [Prochlorococcus marinus subsp. marinus str. CCMP1375]KGG11633.1 hypothetical protein EV04_0920 [Prochlorococcus marinus str. LG]KGG22359.1 hypothetical protein EV08_0177 [Prochlorococcus marinus str. SS2]KGG22695.1 hypothetical protein EV09_1434 [Prochlorococcus marinus str. SS35]KGG32884.1 hypothetical protein EV10_0864 [Prochloroc